MLTISGAHFSVIPDSPEAPSTFPTAYLPFLTQSPSVAHATYRVIPPDTPRLPAIDRPPFWANEIWRMGEADHRIGIEIYNVMRSRWVPVAHLERDFSAGLIQPFHGRRAEPAAFALNYPYDQAILINRLLVENVIVIHGAGIVIDGKGYVFFGPSGIGKTTISRLWRDHGAELLNDDRVAIYATSDGSWRLAGTPWHGEEPIVSPRDVPLAGIIRLRQSTTLDLRSLSPIEGLTELLSCALIPFFSRSSIEQAMDLLSALPESVRLDEFSFLPNRSSLDYFRASM